MQPVAIEKIEDCFGGSAVYRYHSGRPWTREAIRELARLGSLDYFQEFPRPYFRVRSRGGLEVKGIEGECACRVTFPRDGREELRRVWEGFLEDWLRLPTG